MKHHDIQLTYRIRLCDERCPSSGKGYLCDIRANRFRSLANAVKWCLLLLVLTFSPQIAAQRMSSPKWLTSFCGFKFGEIKKNDKGVNESIPARTPFRNFRNVRLGYSSKGRLQSVEAYAAIDKMKPEKGRKEFDLCCRELEKQGISFGDWRIEDEGRNLSRSGLGDFVQVVIDGYVGTARTTMGIHVFWDGVDLDAITPKAGTYNAKSKISRRAFLENVFGVRFGEAIPAKIKNRCADLNDRSESPSNGYCTRLASPVCGMLNLEFDCEGSARRLKSLNMERMRRGPAVQELADIRKEYSRFCDEVRRWLGITAFTSEETENTQDGYLQIFSSAFEDEGIIIKAEAWVTTLKGRRNCSLKIEITGKNAEEQRMKEMILPKVSFGPPETLTDVVDSFRKMSRELDNRNVPEDQRGFQFELRPQTGAGVPSVPRVNCSNISVWEALSLVCNVVKPRYMVEIDGHAIIIKPRLTTEAIKK